MTDAPQTMDLARRHRTSIIVLICMAIGVVALDQLAKYWAVHSLLPRQLAGEGPMQVLGSFLQFNYTENTGAAWSMGAGYTWIFSIVAIVVAIVIIRVSRRLASIGWAVALGGLLGGLLGNLTDRMIREPGPGRGFVVDFIQFPNFPVFNVADMCITGAAILMVLLTLWGIDLRGGRKADAAQSKTPEPTA